MATSRQRCMLADVPKLTFGPQSDTFCSALQIVLQYMGDPELAYHHLLGWSGRGFKLCWSDRRFFWDRHMDQADADPEWYLRIDYQTAAAAVVAAGYAGQVVTNTACLHPSSVSGGARGDAGVMRDLVIASINQGRPVLAALSLSAEHWAPEWSLITGFDDNGTTVLGWSCLQDEDPWQTEIGWEPDGTFRLGDWETKTVAALRLCGTPQDIDDGARAEHALRLGADFARGREDGLETWGVSSYVAWARALEADDLTNIEDDVLTGRMQYHIRYVGHLAAQRWYSSTFLRQLQAPVFCVSDVLHTAACYARIHELMWDCWQVAGGYWRDEVEEVPKFRDPVVRSRIAGIIRAAGELEARTLAHQASALASWDKMHGHYTAS